jgi:hypothetical protein
LSSMQQQVLQQLVIPLELVILLELVMIQLVH